MSRIVQAANEAALNAEHVLYNVLADLDFVSGRQRFHIGGGTITANGYSWIGLGGFASISTITERPDGRDFTRLTLGLNGADPAILAKVPDKTDYIGRSASITIVVHDPVTLAVIEPIESPVFEGFMDYMSYERSMGKANIMLTVKHVDSLYAESIGLFYTSEHQKMLYPGDLICDFIPGLMDKEISWGGGKVAAGVTDVYTRNTKWGPKTYTRRGG